MPFQASQQHPSVHRLMLTFILATPPVFDAQIGQREEVMSNGTEATLFHVAGQMNVHIKYTPDRRCLVFGRNL